MRLHSGASYSRARHDSGIASRMGSHLATMISKTGDNCRHGHLIRNLIELISYGDGVSHMTTTDQSIQVAPAIKNMRVLYHITK